MQINRKWFSFPILFSILFFLIAASISWIFMVCTFGVHGGACTGVQAVYTRDFQLTNSSSFPYINHPDEWPFTSGIFLALVNFLTSSMLTGIALISILLSFFGIGVIFIYEKLGVSWKKYIPIFVLAPVVFEFGYGTEIIEVFLFLLGYYFFKKEKNWKAGLLLGLSSGVKYFPLFTLPFFLKSTHSRKELLVSWLGTFGGGMVIQYLLSPVNFVRSISFYSGYGIEGSWIGLLFPGNIINYTTETTWKIGNGTLIHPLDLYEALSVTLVLFTLYGIYRLKNYSLEEKLLFVFVDAFVFLWISAPQFLIVIAGILPIVASFKLSKLNMPIWYGLNLLCFTPFIWFYGGHTLLTVSYYFQVLAELVLALFIWVSFVVPRHYSKFKESIGSYNVKEKGRA